MQVSSCRMEHALLPLSVHVFIMERHMYKDRCYNRDAVSGECGKLLLCENIAQPTCC